VWKLGVGKFESISSNSHNRDQILNNLKEGFIKPAGWGVVKGFGVPNLDWHWLLFEILV